MLEKRRSDPAAAADDDLPSISLKLIFSLELVRSIRSGGSEFATVTKH